MLLIVLPFGYRQALMLSLVGIVVCLSLVVITGFVGQVSLAQVTLAGVSGFVVSHMIVHAGIGFPWGPLIGSLAAVVVGLIVGASALRVRGASLAVVTLAGVVAIEQFGFANRRWGAGVSGLARRAAGTVRAQPRFERRRSAESTASSRARCWGSCTSPWRSRLCLLVAQIRRSVLGQQMLAVRANERAAAAAGINVARVKIIAYGISSFIAGTAGWMYAYNFGSVSAARFGFLIALGFVAFAYIGGITMVSGAVIGGLVATEGLVPHFFEELLGISGNWTLLVGGLLLIVTLIQNPDGVAGDIYRKRQLQAEGGARRTHAAARRPVAAQGGGGGTVTVLSTRRRLGVVRRREGGGRRRPRRRARAAGRADRPQRRRQDDLHRRHHRIRAARRARSSSTASTSPAQRRTCAPDAGWRARGRRPSCSTT